MWINIRIFSVIQTVAAMTHYNTIVLAEIYGICIAALDYVMRFKFFT
ncbi:hypothetical protein sm9_1284 [Methanobrevibacter millerae]|uniref:Uncharacterized protein n=1 Tax=Methanobrevibacter millerae TaxID=230361 RepID=A0A0U3DRP5_9EURY|nr:hypothetical protein sm9_1284 [Methanobrevibacter millerae]